MEAIGTSFFGLVFIIGLIIILLNKSKKIGIALIIVSAFFLFVLPEITFKKYTNETEGIYTNSSGMKIVIEDGKYEILKSDKIVSSGDVVYLRIDSYSFYLDGDNIYISNRIDEIQNIKNKSEIFYKLSTSK